MIVNNKLLPTCTCNFTIKYQDLYSRLATFNFYSVEVRLILMSLEVQFLGADLVSMAAICSNATASRWDAGPSGFT